MRLSPTGFEVPPRERVRHGAARGWSVSHCSSSVAEARSSATGRLDEGGGWGRSAGASHSARARWCWASAHPRFCDATREPEAGRPNRLGPGPMTNE